MHIIDVFLHSLFMRSAAPKTIYKYGLTLKRIQSYCSVPLLEATPDDIEAAFAQCKCGQNSLRFYMSIASVFYCWAIKRGHRTDNPMLVLDRPKYIAKEMSYFSGDAAKKILSAPLPISPKGLRERALMAVLYYCALRISEALALDVKDIDLQRGTVNIRQAKRGSNRTMPLPLPAREPLVAWINDGRVKLYGSPHGPLFVGSRGRRLSYGTASTAIKWALDINDLTGTPHSFRHSAATHLLDQGADIRLIQEYLRHKNIGSTMIYTHVSKNQLETMSKLMAA